ncbi:Lrp/AsnC family transcriptional regulator [Candidatus Enterococcus ferrettii]|uniref:HTH asnC-type domain-containing protein n=1 Tax=Candidatus Enterococcus ferrettii TaxID=2815324 RepID=A0ABV0EL06_9ENTE|nr:AsnC family transcriptional regulator [Enterococcus sp. 665A]MBO1338956.1 AsnC family transcriptional regulator [Enterococcus sp. 665A]
MDQLDEAILQILAADSRLTNKEIGEQVHLTGQAVGNRITKLKEQGMLKKFTVAINYSDKQFIRLFMKSANFAAVEATVNRFKEVEEFYKVSGQACYVVVAHFTKNQLNQFVEDISKWARYSVETVLIDKRK